MGVIYRSGIRRAFFGTSSVLTERAREDGTYRPADAPSPRRISHKPIAVHVFRKPSDVSVPLSSSASLRYRARGMDARAGTWLFSRHTRGATRTMDCRHCVRGPRRIFSRRFGDIWVRIIAPLVH